MIGPRPAHLVGHPCGPESAAHHLVREIAARIPYWHTYVDGLVWIAGDEPDDARRWVSVDGTPQPRSEPGEETVLSWLGSLSVMAGNGAVRVRLEVHDGVGTAADPAVVAALEVLGILPAAPQ